MGWAPEAGELVIVLQQLKLSIEESHGTNDGYAKGGGDKQIVEHHFLLVSYLGLGQTVTTCSLCYKYEWSENRPARSALSTQSLRNAPVASFMTVTLQLIFVTGCNGS